MKIKLYILALSLLIISTSIGQESTTRLLRVLTYNIHHGVGIDNKFDLDRIVEFIVDNKIDIAALQEVDSCTERVGKLDIPAHLAQKTGMEFAFGGNIKFDGGSYGNLILSKFPILKCENIALPNIDKGEQRGLQIAQIKIENDTIIFLNTHLDHREDDLERSLSAEVIVNRVSEFERSFILCGDLNDTPQSQSVLVISSAMKDTWDEDGFGAGNTYPADFPERKIDYIFYYNNKGAAQLKLQKTIIDSINYSDHLPLRVDFNLEFIH